MSVFKGRLLMLAEKIEDPEQTPSFDMEDYQACGTPLCAAGWTVHFWGNLPAAIAERNIYDRARDLLGLVNGQARPLFYCTAWDKPIENITREDVATELRRLAALA